MRKISFFLILTLIVGLTASVMLMSGCSNDSGSDSTSSLTGDWYGAYNNSGSTTDTRMKAVLLHEDNTITGHFFWKDETFSISGSAENGKISAKVTNSDNTKQFQWDATVSDNRTAINGTYTSLTAADSKDSDSGEINLVAGGSDDEIPSDTCIFQFDGGETTIGSKFSGTMYKQIWGMDPDSNDGAAGCYETYKEQYTTWFVPALSTDGKHVIMIESGMGNDDEDMTLTYCKTNGSTKGTFSKHVKDYDGGVMSSFESGGKAVVNIQMSGDSDTRPYVLDTDATTMTPFENIPNGNHYTDYDPATGQLIFVVEDDTNQQYSIVTIKDNDFQGTPTVIKSFPYSQFSHMPKSPAIRPNNNGNRITYSVYVNGYIEIHSINFDENNEDVTICAIESDSNDTIRPQYTNSSEIVYHFNNTVYKVAPRAGSTPSKVGKFAHDCVYYYKY
jgi:hypothetical protein